MPAAREPIPASLVINTSLGDQSSIRRLNIAVDVDRTGCAAQPLVTIGDSVTHGLHERAIFRTDLSWPAVVAFELGDFRPSGARSTKRRAAAAAYRSTSSAPASFESEFGPKLDWHEIVRARAGSTAIWTGSRTTGSEARGSEAQTSEEILHNLAIYGWDLRDTLSLNATSVRGRLGRPRDDVWLPKQKVRGRQRRAALVVSRPPRGRQARADHASSCARLGAEGTDASDAGPGIETLVVLLGSNNALQAVTKLKTVLERRRLHRRHGERRLSPSGGRNTSRLNGALIVKELRRDAGRAM